MCAELARGEDRASDVGDGLSSCRAVVSLRAQPGEGKERSLRIRIVGEVNYRPDSRNHGTYPEKVFNSTSPASPRPGAAATPPATHTAAPMPQCTFSPSRGRGIIAPLRACVSISLCATVDVGLVAASVPSREPVSAEVSSCGFSERFPFDL